jgi:hypothetical protein
MNSDELDLSARVDSLLKRIANVLILNASFIDNLGLLKGKMGIVIFLYQYFRYSDNKIYEEYAGELLDEIFDEINTSIPVNFEEGLTGIGWGIEYLIHKEFVQANSDEVLSEIDKAIYKHRLNSPILIQNTSKFFGYGFYHIIRLINQQGNSNDLTTILKKNHLIFLIDECERILIYKRFWDFDILPLKQSILNSFLWFLLEMERLQLIPGKTKKLLKVLPEYFQYINESDIQLTDKLLFDFFCQRVSDECDNDTKSQYEVSKSKTIIEDHFTPGHFNNIINHLCWLSIMNLIYKMPSHILQFDIFKEITMLIEDETDWNKRLNDISKDNLGLDGFAGIGFFLLSQITSFNTKRFK